VGWWVDDGWWFSWMQDMARTLIHTYIHVHHVRLVQPTSPLTKKSTPRPSESQDPHHTRYTHTHKSTTTTTNALVLLPHVQRVGPPVSPPLLAAARLVAVELLLLLAPCPLCGV
jgi:hypothetical protein